tara:strand:+ start:1542 stop:2438 length:897 start_codon:yes stop_codon:yes gene_type:complete
MQILRAFFTITSLIVYLFCFASISRSEVVSKLILLVNDIPITQSDFQQRATFIQSNNPQLSENRVSSQAIQELIDEAIKVDASKSMGITYSIDEVTLALDKQLKNQGTSLEKYAERLRTGGTDIKTIINSRIAATVWNQYIIRKFRRYANITVSEVDKYRKDLLEKEIFHIQILKIKNEDMSAEKLYLSENILTNFQSCANNLVLYKDHPDIEVEDIFDIRINELNEPFKTILKHKSDQFLLPTQVIGSELVIMINCTPKKMMSEFEIQNILISNQLKAYSEKELRNLRQDSVIEEKK